MGGAASFRFGASCELNNCTFSQNSANARAGAMLINYGSNVIIDNTTFRQNSTQGNGGAIWVDDQASQYGETKPVISNCTFLENTATFYGGAIHNYNIATTQITNCDFNQTKRNLEMTLPTPYAARFQSQIKKVQIHTSITMRAAFYLTRIIKTLKANPHK